MTGLNLNGHLSVSELVEFAYQLKESQNNENCGTDKCNHTNESVGNQKQLKPILTPVTLSSDTLKMAAKSFEIFQDLIKKGVPIYGVTTGFGEGCTRYVTPENTLSLQKNLIGYLSCGLGPKLSIEASRALFLIRLNSLAQGISGVSPALLERMAQLLSLDILPVIPSIGSLGASGDLVPLAYLGQTIQGEGFVYYRGKIHKAPELFKTLELQPYELKAKEGLAIVNGTSAMAAVMMTNLREAQELLRLSCIATSWLCLALEGRREAFGKFINEVAKKNPGQIKVAAHIRSLLDEENYFPKRAQDVGVQDSHVTEDFIQDRYSLRCVPQILGPIFESVEKAWVDLGFEINGVTDNPVVDSEGQLEMGGNFYGGYLCQAMDLLKINLAHLADLTDRQLMLLMDKTTNRDLPINLIDKKGIDPKSFHVHHGLKGLHQVTSALTSEVIQQSIPSGIFSRSSESHNQDKVSLGMSSAMTCNRMLDGMFQILSLHLICLAQALDLKENSIEGAESKTLYQTIRKYVPFVKFDQSLDQQIQSLADNLRPGKRND